MLHGKTSLPAPQCQLLRDLLGHQPLFLSSQQLVLPAHVGAVKPVRLGFAWPLGFHDTWASSSFRSIMSVTFHGSHLSLAGVACPQSVGQDAPVITRWRPLSLGPVAVLTRYGLLIWSPHSEPDGLLGWKWRLTVCILAFLLAETGLLWFLAVVGLRMAPGSLLRTAPGSSAR